MSFEIIGTGMYVPEKVVTNDDLAKIVDTNDEWIKQRVGISERRVSTNETASEMGYKAAVKALEDADITAQELDLILVATVSGETVSPSMSCMIQNRLGATCMAYDINAACSAFLFLLETAAGYFARKKVSKVLVVGTERMSGIIDWDDRSTCVIFGDGAGAAVLQKGNNYLDSTFTVKGGNDVINIPHYVGKSPFYTIEGEEPYVMMKGQETFKFAVNAICSDIQELLDKNNLTADDIKYIVPHQANMRIIDFASRKLKIPMEKFMVNIERFGNTSSASIPMVLDEYSKANKLEKGDLLLMCAFGGGLAHAACLIRW